MLRRSGFQNSDSIGWMADGEHNNVIGFIASTVEKLRDDVATMREQMATKEDLARVEGRFTEKLANIETGFDEKLAGVETRFDEKLGGVENRFDEKLAGLETRFDGKLAGLEIRFDETLAGLEIRFDEKLARVETRFDEKLSDVETHFDEKLTGIEIHVDEKLARVDGQLSERLDASTVGIRGDIEQIHLRLDTLEHSISSRFEHVEGELSRLRSAVYLLGNDQPDVLRLLGRREN